MPVEGEHLTGETLCGQESPSHGWAIIGWVTGPELISNTCSNCAKAFDAARAEELARQIGAGIACTYVAAVEHEIIPDAHGLLVGLSEQRIALQEEE